MNGKQFFVMLGCAFVMALNFVAGGKKENLNYCADFLYEKSIKKTSAAFT